MFVQCHQFHICVNVVQVNLMQYMKLSTSRDFRINAATLDAALQEQDDSQEVRAILNLVASRRINNTVLNLRHPQCISPSTFVTLKVMFSIQIVVTLEMFSSQSAYI